MDRDLNISTAIMQEVGSAIVRGNYSVNKFPTEQDLSIHYSVSRGAVREAVKMLTSKGMLISRANKGITITPSDQWNMLDPEVLSWILDNPQINVLRDFMQFRLTIETHAAFLAASQAVENNYFNEMPKILEAIDSNNLSSEQYTKALLNFHGLILKASNNTFFIALEKVISASIKANFRFITRFDHPEVALYNEIYKALIEGRPMEAQSAMKELLRFIMLALSRRNEQVHHKSTLADF